MAIRMLSIGNLAALELRRQVLPIPRFQPVNRNDPGRRRTGPYWKGFVYFPQPGAEASSAEEDILVCRYAEAGNYRRTPRSRSAGRAATLRAAFNLWRAASGDWVSARPLSPAYSHRDAEKAASGRAPAAWCPARNSSFRRD